MSTLEDLVDDYVIYHHDLFLKRKYQCKACDDLDAGAP